MTRAYLSACNRVISRVQFLIVLMAVVALSGLSNQLSALQAQATGPKIWLGDRQTLPMQQGPAGLAAIPAQPRSLAVGDVNEDGFADLLIGYNGYISIQPGNIDAFAPQSEASLQAIGRGEFPAPFLAQGFKVSVPVNPDFIAVGRFTGSAHNDVAFAAKGGNVLYVLPGDGRGNFGAPQQLSLPGGVTGMIGGDLGRARDYQNLVLSISGVSGAELAVFIGSETGVNPVAAFPLSGPASNFNFGDFGDSGNDLAFLAGGKVQILRASTMQLQQVSLPVSAVGLAVGTFMYDRSGSAQLALLGADGSVQIAVRNEFDPRVYTVDELAALRQARRLGQPAPFATQKSFPTNGWKIAESFPAVGAVAKGQQPAFFKTRISSNGADDIMWLGAGGNQMVVISHPDGAPGAASFQAGQVAVKPYAGTPQAALPVRINIDGRPGVMSIHQGESMPSMLMPLPDPTFTVNTTADIINTAATPCASATPNQCSVRQALWEANHTAGTDTINIPAGTYTLTIARVQDDCTGRTGALSVNDSVNIVGAGQATTIIQAGTIAYNAGTPNGVDMVMNVNEDLGTANCPLTNATASISSLTLQNGHNRGTVAKFDGDAGCIEFDTGTSGTATLTLTNVTLQNCDTTDGNGGGIAGFNTVNGTGLATISNSIIQGNQAVQGGGTGTGGGVWVADPSRMSLTSVQVLNNKTPSTNGTSTAGSGGGITITSNSSSSKQTVIHSSTISGNQAAGEGGGIKTSANLLVDTGTVISNNSAGSANVTNKVDGGGIFATLSSNGCPAACTDSVTLSKITITGNSAPHGRGGAILNGSPGGSGPLTMSFSRLAGNTALTGNNLVNIGTSGGAVGPTVATVTNNWWGTNNPASTISSLTSATTTFDPFIVLTHSATPSKIRINQSTTLTGDMKKDNHNNAIVPGNLTVLAGLPITFDNPVLGSIPQAQPESLGPGIAATATFNAGGTSGRGHANATVDQAVVDANSNLIATATEAGTTATITTVGPHNLSVNNTVVITGVSVGGYNGTFAITAVPTATTFTYTTTAGLGAGSGGNADMGIIILEPPTITKSFGAATIPINGTTTVNFSINNPNVVAINGSFTDTLPVGLQVAATPGVTSTCGGTVTATAGSGSISFSNNLTPIGVCTISVNITGTVDNTYSNSVQILSTDAGNGNTSSANLTVINPPHIVKAFGAATIPLNGTTSLTFTLDSNSNQNLTITGAGFTDNLPAGLVVATPANVGGSCTGTITATPGSGTVSLSGQSLAPNSSCTVTVDVQGTTAGVKNNSVQATSTNAGTGNTSSASITVVAPPTIAKAFGAASVPLNGTTTLTFTINNPNATVDLSGVAFSDTLPSTTGTLVVSATPGVVNTCGGTVTATAGTGVISLSGGTVTKNTSCTLTVNVTGTAAGDAANTTGAITSTEGGTGTTSNTATLKVVAPPTIAKAFGAAAIPVNSTTTLTFTITNPAVNTTSETGIAFSDTLTNGLQVAATPGVSNTCGGTVTAAANSTSISLTGGSIATPGATCTIVVNVTGTVAGTVTNTTGAVSSTNGGTGATSNTATLIVAAPPSITKAFGAASIPLNGTTSLTFTIQNPNNNVTLNGIAFTDNLPAGLVVAATPNLSNTCGGTATATAGASSVTLSAGTLAASASCTVSVNVTGTTAGVKNNSVQVTSTEGGTGNTSNASVTVVAPPTIAKAFGAASIPLNGTTTLTFTINNPNVTVDLSGVAFSDTLPVSGGAGSATLVVSATPGIVNTCGGTVTATAGTGVISLSGATVTKNTSCTLSVNVTGTVAGDASNTTGAISSTEGGTGATSNTATLKVVAPPTISKAFGAAAISLNGTTTVTFTITNPAANTTAENGIAFSDTLTNGLQVASTPGVSNTCGGTVTAAANSTSISLTGGSIATPGATCTIVVNVTGTQSGTVVNTTGAVSSTNGGTGATSNTATLIVASPPSITKAFGAASIPLNGTTSLTFTIQNPNTNVTLNGIAFTDNLPAGLVVAATPNLSNTCGGTATAVAGAGSVTLSAGTLAASASCTVSVNVTGTTAGVKNNSVQVTSTEGGTGNTSNASVTVVAAPTIAKAFGAASIPLNGSTSLTFTISNPNTTVALSGVAFSDTLPAGLVISTPNGLTGSCGAGTITATQGTNVISLSGGTIAANSSCTFSVNVTGTAAGTQNNTTGNVTSTEGGTGGTASASINVEAPPSIAKAFNPSTISLNATTSLTFTITNPAANVQSLAGVAFTDTLPTGLTVANSTSTVCGGTLTTTAPTGISLSGATIAANGQCQFSVTVTGAASGQYTNTTGNVTSTNGGTGNTATANLTVASPPTITKAFGAAAIPLNGTTSLTFAIQNPNTNITLNGIAFTDNLPAGLVVAATPNLSNTCGGTATAVAGSGQVTLSAGTLAASASCTVSVDVTGTTAGVKNNSVQVTSTEGGTGNTSNASVTVVGPPVIIKAFGAASIPLNGSTSLSFTIQNNNTTVALSGVAFSDTLPAGLVVSTPNGLTGSCGAGTITATQGTNVISLSGGTIAANTSCTFSVNVTGIAAGTQNNTTGNVTSTEGGTGGTASASINVEAPPSIAKVFNPSTIALNATTSLTFTITNPAANVQSLTGVAFTDTLPTGLTVANATASVCGGTLTVTAPTGISLSGATIAANGQCQFSVTVTGAASGQYTNTTGNVTSTNGGTGNTASANLSVASPPTITKAFGAVAIPLNGTTSLTFTIDNPNTNVALTGIAFTDNLPAGLVVAATPNLSNTCGGTATATAGSGSVTLSAGTLAASASCTVSVNVQGTSAGVKNNSVQVTSTEGGTGNTSNASVTVVGPPVIIKAFGAASIPLNGSTSLSFTIQNNNTTVALSGVAFSDTLPAGLVVSTPNGFTGSCGAGTITATQGTNVISLSGGTIAANTSCTFSVNVTGIAAGTQNNTTSQVTSTEGGTGGTASASINVEAPPSIAKVFNPSTIALNATTSLTFTITNPAANVQSLTGVAFTDTLPTGLTVANATATVCGGTLTTTAPTGISLSGATIAANGQCQFSITVTGAAAGQYTNTTGNVTSTNGGTGNTASANLTVGTPPTITKAFGAASILLNASTSLTFNISNPNTNLALTGVAFTDSLPAGLVVATPSALTSNCGGTATAAAGSGSISLTGGTLAASGSCTISLNVTGIQAGVQNNTTGTISSNESGPGTTSNTASITVIGPPSISKAFGAASINLNAQTTLTFTITNPNATVALTGVGFGDTLPAGLAVANPNGLTGSCGAGTITTGTVSGFSVVNLSGGTIAAGGSCTFSVNVVGTSGGHKVNTTGTVTSSNAGSGNQATATIDVEAPDVTITKTHSGTFTRGQQGAQWTITVSNVGFGPTVGTVTMVDTLPNVQNPPVATALSGTGWTCTLATLTCTRADALPSGSAYPPITLTVNIPQNIQNNFTNTAKVSGGGDVNPNNNTATDKISLGPPIVITPHASNAALVQAGTSGQFVFDVEDDDPTLGTLTFGCSGLPVGTACTFNPPATTQAISQVTMTITTSNHASNVVTGANFGSKPPRFLAALFLPVLGFVGLCLGGRSNKKLRVRLVLAVVGMVALLSFAGCSGMQGITTPAGSYQITVTAATTTVQATTQVTLTVK